MEQTSKAETYSVQRKKILDERDKIKTHIKKLQEKQRLTLFRVANNYYNNCYNYNLGWNPIKEELFNHSDYYRKLRAEDFYLYLIPNVLYIKQIFGPTEYFKIALSIYVTNVLDFEKGNDVDRLQAAYIQTIFDQKYDDEKKKINELFNHMLWD